MHVRPKKTVCTRLTKTFQSIYFETENSAFLLCVLLFCLTCSTVWHQLTQNQAQATTRMLKSQTSLIATICFVFFSVWNSEIKCLCFSNITVVWYWTFWVRALIEEDQLPVTILLPLFYYKWLCLTHFPQKICPLIVIIVIVNSVIIVVIIDDGDDDDDDDFQYISNFWDSGRNFGVRRCKYGHTLALIWYFLSN